MLKDEISVKVAQIEALQRVIEIQKEEIKKLRLAMLNLRNDAVVRGIWNNLSEEFTNRVDHVLGLK